MAKPGRNARELQGKHVASAVDLSLARMSDEEAYEVQGKLELANGLRCNGCGRRIVFGVQFTSIAVREQAPVMRLSACSRIDCDYAEECRAGASYMEMVEYVWLDDAGNDAPPTKDFLAARAKREAREQARSRAEQTA